MTMISKQEAITRMQSLITSDSHSLTDRGVNNAIKVIQNMNPIVQPKITNPDDYEDLFDDMIHEVLRVMCGAKGVELNASIELLVDIRKAVVDYANNWHMDLSVPCKEYNVGDKVTIFFEGMPQQAIIINVGYAKYGLFLYHKNNVILIADECDCDSATNYIVELQKSYNID